MADLNVTNGDILAVARAAQHATTTDALVSVKLSRLRRAIANDVAAIVDVFHEICYRHAKKDDATGAPVPAADGNVWSITGTPAVVISPENTVAHTIEVSALLNGSATVRLTPLTEHDLASIIIPEQHTAMIGDALAPFVVATDAPK